MVDTKPNVLMVEDFDKMAEFLKKIFSKFFNITILLNPDSLLKPQTQYLNEEYIGKIKPHIIIMDLFIHSSILQNKSGIECGIELIEKLRLNSKTRDIPIVILSKYGDFVHPTDAFTINHKEYYKKHGMKFGPCKGYKWDELEKFEKKLKDLGIERNKIRNKFNYDEQGYEDLAKEIYEMVRPGAAKNH